MVTEVGGEPRTTIGRQPWRRGKADPEVHRFPLPWHCSPSAVSRSGSATRT